MKLLFVECPRIVNFKNFLYLGDPFVDIPVI